MSESNQETQETQETQATKPETMTLDKILATKPEAIEVWRSEDTGYDGRVYAVASLARSNNGNRPYLMYVTMGHTEFTHDMLTRNDIACFLGVDEDTRFTRDRETERVVREAETETRPSDLDALMSEFVGTLTGRPVRHHRD